MHCMVHITGAIETTDSSLFGRIAELSGLVMSARSASGIRLFVRWSNIPIGDDKCDRRRLVVERSCGQGVQLPMWFKVRDAYVIIKRLLT